uniref:Immunoglobulin domain-containing protein n=1 Tax=Oreochromis aureus TaxID=47969 RepID=A0AAZ1XES8_OREAU
MKAAAASLLLLGVCVLLLSARNVSAVSLSVSPNLQQFFSGSSSVSLSCVDDGQTVDGWTVKMTSGGPTVDCGAAEMSGSLCVLDRNSSYSGTFWCESSSGQQSDEVSISVSEKGVILEIPALPVRPGSDVTLQCKKKTGETVPSFFFMNGRLLGSKAEHVIPNVRHSDEGLYWCASNTFGSSPQSFLRVRGSPITTLRKVICHLLVFCQYCICTILLLSICCSRSSGNKQVVSMETPLDVDEHDDTTEHYV